MKWLYPYDGTVFPAGLAAPTLQWEQDVAPDAVYVHLSSQRFDYKGCFAGSTPPRVTLPPNVWARAFAQSGGPSDPLTVAITTSAGDAVRGPIVETWTFAKGSLKDVVYFDTYTSNLAGDRAAVLSMDPRTGQVSTFLTDPAGTSASGACVSCHSASANGELVVAQRSILSADAGTTFLESDSYDLTDGGPPHLENPAARITTASWGLGAVYPDGSRVLTNGQPGAPDAGQLGIAGNDPGLPGPSTGALYDPRTGAPIASSGLAGAHAMMPAFSPDGRAVVFNDADHGAGHTLAVMDFDAATNAFSNRRELFRDDGAYPGWPAFTPDSKRVVFVDGTSNEFATVKDVADLTGVASGDLTIVDLATGAAHAMDEANGNRDGGTYLPDPGVNADLSFYPTLSPVAAGGYFWVYFTSAREYGNSSSLDAGAGSGKQIWVAAIDTGCATGDGSHPAFLLPGQTPPATTSGPWRPSRPAWGTARRASRASNAAMGIAGSESADRDSLAPRKTGTARSRWCVALPATRASTDSARPRPSARLHELASMTGRCGRPAVVYGGHA